MLQESEATTNNAGTVGCVEDFVTEDEVLLARLGYKQEFKRVFTPLEVYGIGFSIVGLLPSLASVLIYSIPNGGASAMVWGWTTCSVFLVLIALSIAELGSAAPTSGGLYYWTYMFSSVRWRCFLSWIVGYSNTVGNIASVASVDWGCAVQIMAAVSIGSGLTFEPTNAQLYGVYAALLACHAFICTLNTSIIARLQTPYIVLNIVLCFVVIIGLPASTPKDFKNSASYAFGDFTNLSTWPNGFAFVLSFLTPLWTIGAFDSTVHISEEATNANVAIPFAIILATTSSAILGWALNVALVFNMGTDLESILDSPIGQPMATIFFNSFGQKGTLAIWSLIVVIQFTMGTSMLTTCSRQIFAFSRDGALPFSGWLYYISPWSHSPTHCVWFAAFLSLLLGLLAFAGPAAIGAIFSLVIAGQYVAYSIPISARFIGRKHIRKGPFSLGVFSLPVAIAAVSWMAFTVIVFFFPTNQSPLPEDMNYTIVVFGGTLLLVTTYYIMPGGGRVWFTGPHRTVDGSYEVDAEKEKRSSADGSKSEGNGNG